MAKNKAREAPLDELSGLPLTIFYESGQTLTNFQHGWHSKNKLKQAMPKSWARALRLSRGYVIPWALHMAGSPTGYHEAIPEGPKPPATIDGVYSAVSLAVAKVVPRLSIDLTTEPGRYKLHELNNKQHSFLSSGQRTGYEDEGRQGDYYRRKSMGEFVVEYYLRKRQETHDLTSEEDELMHDPSIEITEELGATAYRLFVVSIKELSYQVETTYLAARKEGMVAAETARPTEVILGLAPEHQFRFLFDSARQNITESTQVPLQTGVNEVELAA